MKDDLWEFQWTGLCCLSFFVFLNLQVDTTPNFSFKTDVNTHSYFKSVIKSIFLMDFMLEEELMDLMTFCLQNPESSEIMEKKKRITEIGRELFLDGGIDALENFFFS